MTNRILICFTEFGTFEVISDEPCDVITVCDHTPNDRLYLMTSAHEVNKDRVDEILGDDSIGSAGDDRHTAIRNRVLADLNNRSRFSVIEKDETQ